MQAPLEPNFGWSGTVVSCSAARVKDLVLHCLVPEQTSVYGAGSRVQYRVRNEGNDRNAGPKVLAGTQ